MGEKIIGISGYLTGKKIVQSVKMLAATTRAARQAVDEGRYTDMNAALEAMGCHVTQGKPKAPDLAGKPESDGWIEWTGGQCPVDPQAIVSIEMRECGRSAGRAFTFEWYHRGTDGDIIAYRVAEQKETR